MPEEKSRQILQKMWDKIAKPGADGRNYIVIKDRKDLEYHFWSGFVDDDHYTIQQWVDAFQDSLLPNGAYLVTEEQWMAKVPYHYSGPILPPYDPMTIREGEWSEADLEGLVWEKLKPCVYFTKDEWGRIIGEVKKTLPKKDGKYLISRQLKQEWTTFVNTYSSPRRVLQMGVAQLKAAQSGQGAPASSPQSGFAQGPAASRQVADRLSQLIAKRDR
ncbi:MAG TPA: hypothetical protein VFX30_14215 [bacterium]|nr:hypothetical protein [bacterium]